MPTLDDLRTKWFLPLVAVAGRFPSDVRHKGSAVQNFTDGNLVTAFIDGESYMKEWRAQVLAMIGKPNAEIYHAAWMIDGVATLGNSDPDSDALDVLNEADNADVPIYPLLCNNLRAHFTNNASAAWMLLHGIAETILDDRFPAGGSNHQKFTVFKRQNSFVAMVGGLDITKCRWDRSAHDADDLERDPDFKKAPTHDLGIRIQGPAVADIELTFRERWNDPMPGIDPPAITTPVAASNTVGAHSIQVLHTYPVTERETGYSWSGAGEFTIWSSYLNAIKMASQYIYVEDQYFFSFDWPACFKRTGNAQKSDLVYQLGESIKRGVKVAVLVPAQGEDWHKERCEEQRGAGVQYLRSIAAAPQNQGDFVIATLHNGTSAVMVHSKLLIADDEFVLVGSANFCQRSMTHDSELHVGIVDGVNQFARDLRSRLWAEHLERAADDLQDPLAAYDTFKSDVSGSKGRVRPLPAFPASSASVVHGDVMRKVADPYGGPVR